MKQLIGKLLLIYQGRDVKHHITLIRIDTETYKELCNEMHDMFLDRLFNIKIEEVITDNFLIEII